MTTGSVATRAIQARSPRKKSLSVTIEIAAATPAS